MFECVRVLAQERRQHIFGDSSGEEEKESTTMVKLSNPDEIDVDNITRLTVDELLPEDRQAYEAFMKDSEEESIRRKAEEDEKNRRWYLSHFSKN